MSVLVKGIDMPKSCGDCPFRESNPQSLDPFTDFCYITGGMIGRFNAENPKWQKERKKNCPLVAVSDDAGGFICAVGGEDRAIGCEDRGVGK